VQTKHSPLGTVPVPCYFFSVLSGSVDAYIIEALACVQFSALWREAKLCYVLKFVGGSVVVVSDPCRVATFSVIGSCF
jgi:hypothetical protein